VSVVARDDGCAEARLARDICKLREERETGGLRSRGGPHATRSYTLRKEAGWSKCKETQKSASGNKSHGRDLLSIRRGLV
jgi:hypothetical protein